MTSPARNKPRKSINPAGAGLVERDMNSQAPTEASAVAKGKRRAVQSMGGKPLSQESVLSPKTQARRNAKPRKSILKPIPKFGGNNENVEGNEEEGQETLVHEPSIMIPAADVTLVQGQGRSRQSIISQALEQERMDGYTVNFSSSGRPSISNRRVSFAPSAHVRMFETPANTTSRRRSSIAPPAPGPAPGAVPGQPNTFTLPPPAPAPVASTSSGPRVSNAGHGRRSSINNIAAIGVTDVGDGSVDMSIEEETDDEEADSDDGSVPANQAMYDPPAADSEDEGEMSMEMTQNFGGGVIHQQGDESFMTESSIRSDEEKTMEFTVAIGGVLPTAPPTGAQRGRNSVGYNHLGPAGQVPLVPGEGDEDDMDMDETVAFGGIVNYANPDDTISTNGSDDTINHNHPAREDRTMTFSFGDLQAAAREEQTVEMDMDMEMDMTTVGGGIFANTHTHTHTHFHATQTTSTTPKSPRVQTQPLTRPSGSTPSFARPTASSASKTKTLSTSPEKPKRNIFGPSPSPHRPNTPRKSGMQTAGEVAKRLSFGSASGSVHGSAKRARPEDVEVEEAVQEKRARLSFAPKAAEAPVGAGLGDSIFGRPHQVHPRQSLVRPQSRQSIHAPSLVPTPGPEPEPTPVHEEAQVAPEMEAETTPVAVKSPFRPQPSGTPSRSPAVRRAVGFPEPIPTINIQPEDENESEHEVEHDSVLEEPPVIGLSAFLNMIGAQFVDSVPTMGRRKSLGKGVLGNSTRDRTFQACDYTEAKLESIFLNTYIWATTRIRSEITDCQSELTYNEKSYDQFNPAVITEYLTSNEHDRIQFEEYFKNLRIHTDLKAREVWYDWKMGMMDRVRPDVEEVLNEVLQDEIKLDEMSTEVDDYLPQLRERAALLAAELQKEREVVAELEACNQGELSDWRNTVLDTKKALDEQIAESTEMTTKLGELKSKLGEYESTIRDHESAISSAKSKCDEWTRSDVGKIQREYETLQDLHQWKIQILRADRLEMHYASELKLTFNCSAFIPDIGTASISLLSTSATSGEVMSATEGLMELVKANLGLVLKSRSKLSLAQVVQKIGSQWNSVQRLRDEVKLVSTQFPTTYTLVQGKSTTLKCSTTMLIPSKRSKVVLDFMVGGDVLVNWPAGLLGVGVDVRGIYGEDLDLSILKMAAEEAIAEVREEGYVGVLINACRDAAQQYA